MRQLDAGSAGWLPLAAAVSVAPAGDPDSASTRERRTIFLMWSLFPDNDLGQKPTGLVPRVGVGLYLRCDR